MATDRFKPTGWDHAAIIITALLIAAGIYILLHGAEGTLLMHFDVHGNVDRWGDRREAGIMVLVCAAFGLLTHGIINWSASRAAQDISTRRALAIGRVVGFLTVGLMAGLFASLGVGAFNGARSEDAVRVILAGLWVIIAAVGVLCGKATPNRWAGVRTYWTRTSRLAWERSNRLLGRIYFFGAIVGLIATPVTPRPWLLPLFVGIVSSGALIAMFEAWRVWKADPDKQV